MAKAEHYKKKQERDNINRLLAYMKEKGPLTFTEGKKFLNVSSATMTSYVDQLRGHEIEHYYILEKGRRRERYRLKKESFDSVSAQVGRYEAVKFIQNIPNPAYGYRQDGNKAIAAIMAVKPTENRKKVEAAIQKTISTIMIKLLRLPKDRQVAVVIMVKGKEDVKP